ncbi:pepF/M3 family oligoendopeptidase [Thermosporothrix hazakensis]|jgi:pepF/M3 family oligoendopeptidase|uniref:PepF/M3 family oligoendopeptidase n=2 Tax=Thermosporothrix TaxID=768650 RepID=A0A326UEW0_THEHA|nr:M3 family oligoendopeptidase [Thermosporothrix hazakensis]PZW29213.1 pepF/M3 family oligoendopeptidase [Thermosporothrix hazakensis]BBH86143.1 oligoendopeptidase F [Thermosporothrix sp. COM3]GCE45435.1 oligoendopeptidase F [Thermosporothrix hazakensis]
MTTAHTLPRWDLTTIYPGLDSPEFTADFQQLARSVDELAALFDTYGVNGGVTAPVDETLVQHFEEIIKRYNAIRDAARTLVVYITSHVNTNSRDTTAQARYSEYSRTGTKLYQLSTRLTAWIGSLEVEELIKRSQVAADHAYALRTASKEAKHLMSPAEEVLASELNLSGGAAWSRLHGNIASQMRVSLELAGESKEYPMSAIRNFAFEADREVRRKAYEAELAAWERVALPLAAAMNSIKHEVNVLSQKRNWETPLDASLFANSIDRQTLDAMMSAARASFPDFRRYLRAKARLLGLEKLAWYDLFAPVARESRTWHFEEAAAFIVKQFGTYSPRLAGLAERAFREGWIDAEPRPGKRDGAYCTSLRADESRILANFKPAYGGMSTLAHELGHAYHNFNMVHRTPLQRGHPMTLAETASIFCETIIKQATLAEADKQEKLAILEASLQDSCQVVVDITSRFLFEQGVFEKRLQRELSVGELNELMLESQRQTYGDGLDESLLHPYMWAVKGHYYSTGLSFYNYPYMFGLLFGLGLYAYYQRDPETFKAGYDELLSSTGMADAAELAQRFGIDIRSEAFWRSSLDIIRQDIDEFERLAREA